MSFNPIDQIMIYDYGATTSLSSIIPMTQTLYGSSYNNDTGSGITMVGNGSYGPS